MPTVSVVIPTYNHRDFVLNTLNSVFAQTFQDVEVIVVNDGSPDDTHELLQPLVESGRIRYVRQENASQAAARNKGIELATGEFIALLDDDDLWPADSLVARVVSLRQNPLLVLSYGRTELVGQEGKPLTDLEKATLKIDPPADGPTGDAFSEFLKRNYILSPGQTLIRHSALKSLREPAFDTDLWGVDDFDLWLRLACIGPFTFLLQTVLQYRVHGGNASRQEARMHLNEMHLYRKHAKRMFQSRMRRDEVMLAWEARRNRLSRYWFATALKSMRNGKISEARNGLTVLMKLQR